MKIKLFEGTDLSLVETEINGWLGSTHATIVNAQIRCGHPYSYVVLITYEEYGNGSSNATYVATTAESYDNYVTPTNQNWHE